MPKRVTPKLPGPPPVRNHTGVDWLSDKGSDISVTLDAGAFFAVWGAAEAGAKKLYGSEAQKAFERARDSLRAAYWREHPELLEILREQSAPKPPAKPKKSARKA